MPHTRPIPDKIFLPFEPRLRWLQSLGDQCNDRPVSMDPAAAHLWEKVYPGLREDRPGLAGALVSRGAPLVLRLALIYRLAGGGMKTLSTVRVEHLKAALAVWAYCEESARMLFQDKAGDPLGDKLLLLLRNGPMTRAEFNRHLSAQQKTAAGAVLAKLEAGGLVRREKVAHEGAGRPAERWELA
jgi:hypothetical protein